MHSQRPPTTLPASKRLLLTDTLQAAMATPTGPWDRAMGWGVLRARNAGTSNSHLPGLSKPLPGPTQMGYVVGSVVSPPQKILPTEHENVTYY